MEQVTDHAHSYGISKAVQATHVNGEAVAMPKSSMANTVKNSNQYVHASGHEGKEDVSGNYMVLDVLVLRGCIACAGTAIWQCSWPMG